VSAPLHTLLVVDDESYILTTLGHLFASDFQILTADCAEAAQEIFSRQPIDVILTDQKMPRTTGVQLLEWVREHHPKTIRLLMTGYVELDDAIAAINFGVQAKTAGINLRVLSNSWGGGAFDQALLDAINRANSLRSGMFPPVNTARGLTP